MGRRVYHSYHRGFRTCNSQQDIVDFLRKNPGYYSETELFKQCFGFDRNNHAPMESNKKYADLLRRAWAKGLVTRRVKAGTTARYEWFLVTDSDSEKKNFSKLLENRNIGQTFTSTNLNNIHTMENTSITTATVQSCIASIFTKEDVLNLLEQQKAEILASIPKPEPQVVTVPYAVTREMLLKVASEIISTFEQSIDDGLRNTDFQDIVNDCDIEVTYDKRIEINIDGRSASDAVNEAIGYELPDSECLADLIDKTLKEAQDEADTESTEPQA